jgi:hypothetical protein
MLWCGLHNLYEPQPGRFDALQTVRQTTRGMGRRGGWRWRHVVCCRQSIATPSRPLPSPLPPSPSYELYQASTYCNDLALLELNASAVHAAPIAGGTLPSGGFDFPPGHLLTAVGWGLMQDG